MKRLLKIISILFIFVATLVGIVVFATPEYKQEAIKVLSYSICDTPTKYKIGTIDTKFGGTQSQIKGDLQKAANIWNDLYSKELFKYSEDAKLTVNFTYDQRSSLYTYIDELQKQLDQKNTTYEQQVAAYEKNLASFNKRLSDFNSTVDSYNKSGGAPPDIYNKLILEQEKLQEEDNVLKEEASRLNISANIYNSEVEKLNQNINEFNSVITQKPEEGLYDPNNNTITIYFITSQDELIHTLAHEFGHALDFQHVTDPKSIMYPYTSKILTPAAQDVEQLNLACAPQPIFEHWVELLTEKVIGIVESVQGIQ
jgi:hypothetical protein